VEVFHRRVGGSTTGPSVMHSTSLVSPVRDFGHQHAANERVNHSIPQALTQVSGRPVRSEPGASQLELRAELRCLWPTAPEPQLKLRVDDALLFHVGVACEDHDLPVPVRCTSYAGSVFASGIGDSADHPI